MDSDTALAIITQLSKIEAHLARTEVAINALIEHVEKSSADLDEFSERFEEIMTRLEQERRLDWQTDF